MLLSRTRRMVILLFSASMLSSALLTPCRASEFTFDIEEIEKKPYSFGGHAEINPVLYKTNKKGVFHRLAFYDRHQGSTLGRHDMTLQLEGSYEKGIARAFARTSSNLNYTHEGWSGKTTLFEGYLSLRPSPSLRIDAGKKTLRWGTGYAWNPVAFFDRPKDPEDPGLNLEGYFMLTLDYVRSFDGPLKTVSFTPVLVPAYGDLNRDFGDTRRINFGARLYFLFYDTDIDLMFLSGGDTSSRYGFDFSRNITSNFEIHGELARLRGFRKRTVRSDGSSFETRSHVWSWLLGIRYLTAGDTTYILEYYRDGTGFTEWEMKEFYSYVDRGYDRYLGTGDDDALRRAAGFSRGGYGRANPMKDYLYLRASKREPFDILYFTPSLTCVFNVNDRSFSVSPELVYTGMTDMELRLRATALVGGRFTEYGERRNRGRLELRVRYYF